MNIKIEIQAPELVKAINALAEALNKQDQTMRTYMVQTTSSKEQEPSTTPVQNAAQSDSEPLEVQTPPTVSELKMDVVALRKAVTDGIKDGKFTNADVRTKLGEFNVTKLTDLSADQYEAFLGVLFG